jgi:F-type H+-transporting ATPase subunit delta
VSARSVARQYANALFDVASRSQRVTEVGRHLAVFSQMVAGSSELRAVFLAPTVPMRRKRAVVDALLVATGDTAPEVHRLLTLLADRDRLSVLADIAAAYDERVMDANRIMPADVVTAVEITEDRKQALAEALGRATGRQVTMSTRVDPSILGGVVARVGSLVFDGSVVGQLDRLRQRLSADA